MRPEPARARHRRKPLTIAKQIGTSFIEFASGCFSGSALLGMIVTLSPAPSCGSVACTKPRPKPKPKPRPNA